MTDNVNHPEHYTSGEIECIDAIRAALTPEEFRGFCKGNVIKYAWRERLKGGNESLRKAIWYADKAIGEKRAASGSGASEAKPSWEDAPEWAQWSAQDSNGNWFWYATQPKKWNNDQWVEKVDSQTKYALLAKTSNPNPNWRNTLEPRPTTPDYMDGYWHDWHGGECPVPGYMVVEVESRWDNRRSIASASLFSWNNCQRGTDIIRFRVVK